MLYIFLLLWKTISCTFDFKQVSYRQKNMDYEKMYILALSTEIIWITNNNPDLAVKFNCIYREAIDNTLVKIKNAKEKSKRSWNFLIIKIHLLMNVFQNERHYLNGKR